MKEQKNNYKKFFLIGFIIVMFLGLGMLAYYLIPRKDNGDDQKTQSKVTEEAYDSYIESPEPINDETLDDIVGPIEKVEEEMNAEKETVVKDELQEFENLLFEN